MPEPQKPVKSDPWEEAAKNFKAEPGASSPTEQTGDDDWKVWQQGSENGNGGGISGGLTEIRPNQSDTLPHAIVDTFSNIGAGGLGALATLGRISPWGALADHLQGKPTIYGEAYDAVTHPRETGEGLVRTLKDVAQHPLENVAGAIGAAGAAGMIPEGANLAAKIPSKTRAAGTLQKVMQTVGDKPVTLSRTLPELEAAQKLSLWKHGNIPALDDLYNRINTVNPIDFEEAKGRYEPISKLTTNDRMNTTGKLQGQTKKLAHAMRSDLVESAENASPGMGDLFDKGMREYASASRNADIAKKVAKWGGGAVAGGLGLEGAHRLLKAFQ